MSAGRQCKSYASTSEHARSPDLHLIDPHALAHFLNRLPSDRGALRRAARECFVYEIGLGLELRGARLNGNQLFYHVPVQDLLAVDAAPAGATALCGDVLDGLRRAERLVQMIDVAHL